MVDILIILELYMLLGAAVVMLRHCCCLFTLYGADGCVGCILGVVVGKYSKRTRLQLKHEKFNVYLKTS